MTETVYGDFGGGGYSTVGPTLIEGFAARYLRRCRAAGDLRPIRVLLAEIVQPALADALASSLERLWAV